MDEAAFPWIRIGWELIVWRCSDLYLTAFVPLAVHSRQGRTSFSSAPGGHSHPIPHRFDHGSAQLSMDYRKFTGGLGMNTLLH
jgi:hypothetical protein